MVRLPLFFLGHPNPRVLAATALFLTMRRSSFQEVPLHLRPIVQLHVLTLWPVTATTFSDDNGRVSVSRQTFRADDSKPRWLLGRSASAKIKEGFGLKRSQAS